MYAAEAVRIEGGLEAKKGVAGAGLCIVAVLIASMFLMAVVGQGAQKRGGEIGTASARLGCRSKVVSVMDLLSRSVRRNNRGSGVGGRGRR